MGIEELILNFWIELHIVIVNILNIQHLRKYIRKFQIILELIIQNPLVQLPHLPVKLLLVDELQIREVLRIGKLQVVVVQQDLFKLVTDDSYLVEEFPYVKASFIFL